MKGAQKSETPSPGMCLTRLQKAQYVRFMSEQNQGMEPPSHAVNHRVDPKVLSWEMARLKQSLPLLVSRVMAYSAMTRFDEDLIIAVREFYGLDMDVATAEAEILEDEDERIRFFPWFLWDFDQRVTKGCIGQEFGKEFKLARHEEQLLSALINSYVGFFEALTNANSEGATLRNLATNEIIHIADEGLEGDLLQHHILQARVLEVPSNVEPIVLIDAVYATLPPESKPAIHVELMALMSESMGPRGMKAFAPEMLHFTDHLLESLAKPPELRNSCGDTLSLCQSTLDDTQSATLRRDLPDSPGFISLEPKLWQWCPEEGPRGFVDARSERVVLAANSLTRLDALIQTLARILEDFRAPVMRQVEDFGRTVQHWAEQGDGETWLRADPEIPGAVRSWLSAWARHWLDTPSAVLGGLTPREGVNHPEGRRRIEQMLTRFEDLQLGRMGMETNLSLSHLRDELGIS